MIDSSLPAETVDRAERIVAIRREIAAGTYETPEKLSAALEAFLDAADSREPPSPRPR